tara:strand:- start:1393 stop:2100 length:708 start_codon:yes stop_codon:yes gene_type:complete
MSTPRNGEAASTGAASTGALRAEDAPPEGCAERWTALDREAGQTAVKVAMVRASVGPCGSEDRRRAASVLCAELLEEAPRVQEGWVACGHLLEAGEEHARAMRHYRRARELDPEGAAGREALRSAASLALRFRDFVTAAELYGAWAEAAPGDARAWWGLAVARRGRGDSSSAVAALRRSLALEPAPGRRFQLALWLREGGAMEEAALELRRFLAETADAPTFADARAEARELLAE